MTEQSNPPVRSITDLARIAGVSVSTVSRALTAKGALNKETRRRIQELAAEHGFKLNVAAQNLRLGRTGAIAVLLPFFMAMLGFLADELTERGYDLLLSRVLPDGDDWLDNFIRSGRVDGVIIIGQSDQNTVLDRTAEHYRPLVIWGAYSEHNRYLTVGTDNQAGGALAARHLLDRGRTKLTYFGNVDVPEFAARYDGFLNALPDDVRHNVDLVVAHVTPEESHRAASEFFAAGNRPEGIFAGSDVTAMSVIAAAVEHGIDVPGALSVVGFDDVPMARLANPPLTTVRQDIRQGAHLLVDLLCRRLSDDDALSVQIAPEIVLRESS